MPEQFNGEKPVTNYVEPMHAEQWEPNLAAILESALDAKPEHLKTNVPTLLAPGWSEGPSVLEEVAATLLGRQRRVLSLNHPRHGKLSGAPDNFSLGQENKEYPDSAYQRALNLIDLIEAKNIPQVDVIAHSQGGIDATVAASLRPELFRNIVFVDPGGMVGPDTLPRLAGRFSMKMIHDTWKQRRAGTRYIASNPVRAMAEAVAISRSEVVSMLEDLHEAGIGIIVVHGVDDPVFPMDRMQDTLSRQVGPDGQPVGEPISATHLDGFVSVRGGHDELLHHPEAYTGAAEELLSALENKKHGPDSGSLNTEEII